VIGSHGLTPLNSVIYGELLVHTKGITTDV
jgi:hypothetical protein